MQFAMSDEYAAIVVSVDAALLVVGTVQFHSLVKASGDYARAAHARGDSCLRAVGNRLAAGDEPTEDELAAADRWVHNTSHQVTKRFRQPALVGLVWGIVSFLLGCAVVATVVWAAKEKRSPSPQFALFTVLVTALAAVVLMVEAAFRVIWDLTAVRDEMHETNRAMDSSLHALVLRRVEEYRRASLEEPSQGAPDPATAE